MTGLLMNYFKWPRLPLRPSILVCIALLSGLVLAEWAKPRNSEVQPAPRLEDTIPRQFGDWKELNSPYLQVRLETNTVPGMSQPYDQTLMRTYVNSQGQQIMVALAWGQKQSQEVKTHRPDVCYVAQGFAIKTLEPTRFKGIATTTAATTSPVTGQRMVAMNSKAGEAVAYWIRIGSVYSESAWETRKHILTEGFAGRVPDGVLVRASQTIRKSEDAAASFPLLEQFLADLVAASPPSAQALMVR